MNSITKYIEQHTEAEDPVLTQLTRETHLKVLMPRMLSGQVQGKMLEMISRMLKPGKILEIGTYTGYSAICLAKGLKNGGRLHTIEIKDELQHFAQKYFQLAGMSDKIEQHIGNALDIVSNFVFEFDLAFIDGDKRQYPDYYKLVIEKIKTGGHIIADNVLWDGKVINTPDDAYTKGVVDFNTLVQNDKRAKNVLIPVRDGLMLIEKVAS